MLCGLQRRGSSSPRVKRNTISKWDQRKEKKRKEKKKKKEPDHSTRVWRAYYLLASLTPLNLWIWWINFDKVGYLLYSGIHGISVTTMPYCTVLEYSSTGASTRNKSRRERLSNSSTCYWCVAFFSLFFFLLFSFPFLPLLFLSPSIHIRCLAVYSGWENWYNKLRLMNMQFRSIIGNTMNFPNVGFFSWF